MHGDNESIPVEGFRVGLRMFVEMVLDLATEVLDANKRFP